jgi:threonylcarbamoyladenosine tRNA methylthiotransferase MtaB
MMKFSILTLGCKVNQAESDVIEGNLIKSGYSVVPLSRKPDYCIVNTCSVTTKSDYQSRQLIRRAVRASANVIVTGCYAQLRPEDIRRINRDIHIVQNNIKYSIINIIDHEAREISLSYSSKSRPSIKVQDGCNYACSYCIVPKARGRAQSIQSGIVVDQILNLEVQGYSEIVLTGIHLGSYGHDLNPKQKLSDLIETILNKTKIKRIRLSSIGVNEIDNRIVELLQETRICKHLHVPLQSGNDMILKRMNRLYDATSYLEKISTIIVKNPNIAIGTDVIVGFPGENDRAFLKTKDLIEEIPFSYLHIFPFSSRPGTAASRMIDQIEAAVKKKRHDVLNLLNNVKKTAYMSSQINKTLEIVVEDEDPDQGMVGTSSNYLKIRVRSKEYPRKSLVTVSIAGRAGDALMGVPIEKL